MFRMVGVEYDEENSMAAENPTMVSGMKSVLETIRNERGYYIKCR